MDRRIAIIDLGTNTFHLLIAEIGRQHSTILHRERHAVKLGMEGITKGIITEEAKMRALESLGKFKWTIDHHGITEVLAFGTSAFRNATNRDSLIQDIQKITGISVKVLTGPEEATYIYKGVRASMNLGLEKSLIMDIGGGSVEFIIGSEKEVFWMQSFEIGAQRLLEHFHQHDPMPVAEQDKLLDYLKHQLDPLDKALKMHQPRTLVGASGTFDTLAIIHCRKHHIDSREEDPEIALTFDGFREIYRELLTKNRAERLSIDGMIEMRVDMIVVASILIHYVLSLNAFSRIRVSTYSLKEGVLAEMSEQGAG